MLSNQLLSGLSGFSRRVRYGKPVVRQFADGKFKITHLPKNYKAFYFMFFEFESMESVFDFVAKAKYY